MPKAKNLSPAMKQPRAVLAYERGRTVTYDSMGDCIRSYGIPSCSMLRRLIDHQQCWTDGYTTFDYATSPVERRLAFSEMRTTVRDAYAKIAHSSPDQMSLSLNLRTRYDKAPGGIDGQGCGERT
jgi:hypothetical protein